MKTEMGEFIVGAYLKIIEECDFVDYNVRAPGGGLTGLNELDVIGLNFKSKTAFICEVTTHIRGLLYKDNQTTVERIKKKHNIQKAYGRKYLSDFHSKHYMLWSPYVPVGYLTEGLAKIPELQSVINREYTERIELLRKEAGKSTHDAGNPFFRALQILEHLRR